MIGTVVMLLDVYTLEKVWILSTYLHRKESVIFFIKIIGMIKSLISLSIEWSMCLYNYFLNRIVVNLVP